MHGTTAHPVKQGRYLLIVPAVAPAAEPSGSRHVRIMPTDHGFLPNGRANGQGGKRGDPPCPWALTFSFLS